MTDHRVAYFISLDSIHCKKWIKHLSKNNKCIIITYNGMVAEDPSLSGIKVFSIFPKKFPVKNFLSRWFALIRISLILKQNKITLIHSMYCYPNSIWAGYFRSYKKIITTRGSDVLIDYKNIINSDNPSLIYLRNKLELALKEAVYITCTSLQQKQFLLEKGFEVNKISVVRTGIEPENFSVVPHENSVNKEFRILSPRSIQKNYNIHTMLMALKDILNANPELKLRFDQVTFNVNPGYLKSLHDLIKENGLEKQVHFIEPYDLRSVSEVYADHDLALMLPQSDGTPVSALEVMINKKPLIISRLPYDSDLISEEFCWFVDQNDVKQISACILKIVKADQSELKQKTDKAYENVLKNANTHNEMKKILQLYNSIQG